MLNILVILIGVIATLLGVAAICSVKLSSMIDESTLNENINPPVCMDCGTPLVRGVRCESCQKQRDEEVYERWKEREREELERQ